MATGLKVRPSTIWFTAFFFKFINQGSIDYIILKKNHFDKKNWFIKIIIFHLEIRLNEMNIYKWKTWGFSLMSAVTSVKSTMYLKYLQSILSTFSNTPKKEFMNIQPKNSQTPNSSLNPILIQLSNIYLKAFLFHKLYKLQFE